MLISWKQGFNIAKITSKIEDIKSLEILLAKCHFKTLNLLSNLMIIVLSYPIFWRFTQRYQKVKKRESCLKQYMRLLKLGL